MGMAFLKFLYPKQKHIYKQLWLGFVEIHDRNSVENREWIELQLILYWLVQLSSFVINSLCNDPMVPKHTKPLQIWFECQDWSHAQRQHKRVYIYNRESKEGRLALVLFCLRGWVCMFCWHQVRGMWSFLSACPDVEQELLNKWSSLLCIIFYFHFS